MDLQRMKRELFEKIDKRSRLEKQLILCLFEKDRSNIDIIRQEFYEMDYRIMAETVELEKLIGKAYIEKFQIETRIDYLIQTRCTDDLERLVSRVAEINRDLEIL